MSNQLRWGILGTGNIANQFAADIAGSQRTILAAVGSRSRDTAAAFAQRYHIPAVHGSYDALLADPTVDAVYNSLPNAMHHEWTIKALALGKHVLCEKPIASNAAQAQEMFDVARQQGRILIEAFMYRSHPLTHAVMAKLPEIGRIKLVRTSFCFRVRHTQDNCRFSAELAGGALMDIGCYCTNFTRMIVGSEPTSVHARGHLHQSGVDDYVAGVLHFPGDVLATFTCGLLVQADNTVSICGEDGYIEIPVAWKPPVSGAVFRIAHSTPPRMDEMKAGRKPRPIEPQVIAVDAGKPLYALEADDFAATVLDGKPPTVSAADTLGNMRLMDELRRQVGVPV